MYIDVHGQKTAVKRHEGKIYRQLNGSGNIRNLFSEYFLNKNESLTFYFGEIGLLAVSMRLPICGIMAAVSFVSNGK